MRSNSSFPISKLRRSRRGHGNTNEPPSANNSNARSRKQYLMILTAAAFITGFLFGNFNLSPSNIASEGERLSSVEGHGRSLEPIEILGELSIHQIELEKQLRLDYGDYFPDIFDKSTLDKVFRISEVSRERLVRRMTIKVLSVLLHPTSDVTFTWATAGDSAAAGHGNLFKQSYTAVMEDTVKDAFASAGIRFVGKNFAMGGYGSGPELALCMESVYGSDLDVLSWDFGLTDIGFDHRLSLWGYRAGVHPTKPVLFMMDSSTSGRWEHFSRLEKIGMGAVLMDQIGLSHIKSRLPDTMDEKIDQGRLPLPLRNFLCNGHPEGAVPCNDPLRHFVCSTEERSVCGESKFNTFPDCDKARYQTTWNPGWKEHYLKGRLLGYLLVDLLSDALLELDSLRRPKSQSDEVVGNDLEIIYDALQLKENEDRTMFQLAQESTFEWETDKETLFDVNPVVLSRGHAICHTSLLPSQIRYDGIVTEHTPEEGYDKGMNKETMLSPNGILPLVYDPSDRQSCNKLEIDYKDFFYVRSGDGWLSATVPNSAEIKAYGGLEVKEALIMMCLKVCPFGRCLDESIDLSSIQRGDGIVSIQVDGRPVTGVEKLEGCHFLVGDRGLKWRLNEDGSGQYKLKFKVDGESGRWMRISSIITLSYDAKTQQGLTTQK